MNGVLDGLIYLAFDTPTCALEGKLRNSVVWHRPQQRAAMLLHVVEELPKAIIISHEFVNAAGDCGQVFHELFFGNPHCIFVVLEASLKCALFSLCKWR